MITRGRRVPGFTLIELMIVVAIVAILAGLALAGYEYAIRKTRRAAAQGCLTEAAQFMERHYTIHMSYVSAMPPACSADVTDHYTIAFAAGEPTAATYRLEAVPHGAQAKDTACGTMSIDDRTRKTPETGCW